MASISNVIELELCDNDRICCFRWFRFLNLSLYPFRKEITLSFEDMDSCSSSLSLERTSVIAFVIVRQHESMMKAQGAGCCNISSENLQNLKSLDSFI